jgi:hypothetical protein
MESTSRNSLTHLSKARQSLTHLSKARQSLTHFKQSTTIAYALKQSTTIAYALKQSTTIAYALKQSTTIAYAPKQSTTIAYAPKQSTTIAYAPTQSTTIAYAPKQSMTVTDLRIPRRLAKRYTAETYLMRTRQMFVLGQGQADVRSINTSEHFLVLKNAQELIFYAQKTHCTSTTNTTCLMMSPFFVKRHVRGSD